MKIQKLFKTKNYVVLPMKIVTLTYKYFEDRHVVTLTKLGIGCCHLYI
jgi:hypothetical protein